jgi:hypothetical protein
MSALRSADARTRTGRVNIEAIDIRARAHGGSYRRHLWHRRWFAAESDPRKPGDDRLRGGTRRTHVNLRYLNCRSVGSARLTDRNGAVLSKNADASWSAGDVSSMMRTSEHMPLS